MSATRVLHVIDNLRGGGAQTLIYDLAVAKPYRDIEIEVATLVGPGALAPKFEEAGIRVHSLATRKWDVRYLWRLRELVRNGRFDVIHAHLLVANFLLDRGHAALGRPRYIDQLHNMPEESPPELAYQRYLERFAFNRSDAIVACAKSVGDAFRAYRPHLAAKVIDLPNAIHTEGLAKIRMDRSAARAHYGYAEDDFVVGSAGRLALQKNFPLLLRALKRASPRIPRLHLVIMGEGPLEAELRAQAKTLGIAERVRFAGYVKDAAGHFPLFDVFVLASHFEGLGLVLGEAMAQGVPGIATAFPPAFELIEPGETGLIVPLGDELALAAAIELLHGDSNLRRQFSERGCSKIAREFGIANYWSRLREVYRA